MVETRERIDDVRRDWRWGVLVSLLTVSVALQAVLASEWASAASPSAASAPSPAAASSSAAAPTAAPSAAPTAGANGATPMPSDSIAPPVAANGDNGALAAPASKRHVFKIFYGTSSNRVPVGRLEYTLQHDGVSYEIRTKAQAEGLVSLIYSGVMTQVSSGRVGPSGLEPLQYAEKRGNRAERTLSFDREQGVLTTANGQSTVGLPAGTQDRLSVLYQLGLMVRAAPDKFVAGTTHVLPVASMSRVSEEHFDVIGPTIVSPTDRPIRALHISRPRVEGSDDPIIDVWLGYDFGMLPVRVRMQGIDGRVLDQLIEQGG